MSEEESREVARPDKSNQDLFGAIVVNRAEEAIVVQNSQAGDNPPQTTFHGPGKPVAPNPPPPPPQKPATK